MMHEMRRDGGTGGLPPARGAARWLPALLLVMSMWLLSGCVITPITAQDGTPSPGGSATIAIAPVSAQPGDTVFVSGAGWVANEPVYVNLEHAPDGETIQNEVYAVGKEHGFEPLRDWFKALYEVLFGVESGRDKPCQNGGAATDDIGRARKRNLPRPYRNRHDQADL